MVKWPSVTLLPVLHWDPSSPLWTGPGDSAEAKYKGSNQLSYRKCDLCLLCPLALSESSLRGSRNPCCEQEGATLQGTEMSGQQPGGNRGLPTVTWGRMEMALLHPVDSCEWVWTQTVPAEHLDDHSSGWHLTHGLGTDVGLDLERSRRTGSRCIVETFLILSCYVLAVGNGFGGRGFTQEGRLP